MCVRKCLVRLADLGKIFPQYLQQKKMGFDTVDHEHSSSGLCIIPVCRQKQKNFKMALLKLQPERNGLCLPAGIAFFAFAEDGFRQRRRRGTEVKEVM